MKVNDLQQACAAQGLNHDGLNKRGLIRILQENDERRAQEENGSEEEIEDSDVSFRQPVPEPSPGESEEGRVPARGGGREKAKGPSL